MAATLLAPGRSTITNLPAIADVDYMAELLTRLGCKVEVDKSRHEVNIDVPEKLGHRADYDLVRKMRASINVLGPLIARELIAEVALPGGDAIGSRGLDYHINGLTDMGADVNSEHGFVIAKAPKGYSILYTHPLNRHDLPFRTFSGVVESDNYDLPVNFPFQLIISLKENENLIVPKGTPVVQFIPIKRENWNHEKIVEQNLYKRQKASNLINGTLVNAYKKLFWVKKTYN
jgi:hypothetical protein